MTTSQVGMTTVTFYAGGATPGALLATYNVAPTITPGTFVLHTATLITPFDAVGGTQYWVSIFNGAPDARWAWQASSEVGNSLQRRLDTDTYNSTFAVAFSLESADVPEPASILLLGAGTALIFLRRRTRS